MLKSWGVLILAVSCAVVYADGVEDARKLKEEAIALLKKNSNREAPPEEAAKVIFNLEKAMNILEAANDTTSDLAEEVNRSLFWARKFSDVKVMAALDAMKGGSGKPITPPPTPRVVAKPTPKPTEDGEPENTQMEEAKKAFDLARRFSDKHSNDDYLVAMNWFKMANEHTGTDYALKALSLAREAQTRFSKKNTTAVVDEVPGTPEMLLVREADSLVNQRKFDEAIAIYKSSIKMKDSLIAHRKLGHAYYSRGQMMKDDLMPKFEEADQEIRRAWKNATVEKRSLAGGVRKVVNRNDPQLIEAFRKRDALTKDAYKALGFYDSAKSEFNQVLKLAPGGKDLDAAGHIGLCLAVRGDPMVRLQAKQHLSAFLRDYKPVNDIERSLYEYCKSDLQRISK